MKEQSIEDRRASGVCCYQYVRHRSDEPQFICSKKSKQGSDLCVAHASQRTPEEDAEVSALVGGILGNKALRGYDFRGFIFPASFDIFQMWDFGKTIVHLDRSHFLGDALFFGAKVDHLFCENARIEGAAYFGNAVLTGTARFCGSAVMGNIDFQGVAANRRLDFAGVETAGSLDLTGARLCLGIALEEACVAKDLLMRDLTLDGGVDSARATIGAGICMSESHVKGNVSFSETRVKGDLDLMNAQIQGDLYLASADIDGDLNLSSANVSGCTRMTGARIGGDTSFEHARLAGPLDFGCVDFGGLVSTYGTSFPTVGEFRGLKTKLGRGVSLFCFAKLIRQNMGDCREAGYWHYRERCDSWYSRTFMPNGRIRLFALLNPYTWIEYLFGKLVSGYGERPINVLVMSALLMLALALYYRSGAIISLQGQQAGFWESLYFSVLAFTTFGFGEYMPRPDFWPRFWASFEALAGLILAALFVTTLARRWGRG